MFGGYILHVETTVCIYKNLEIFEKTQALSSFLNKNATI